MADRLAQRQTGRPPLFDSTPPLPVVQSAVLASRDAEPQAAENPQKLHVAIIMDGNGRWASARGRPRTVGHRIGTRSVRRVVEAAPNLQIGTLTLYAFSADNWRRPALEVSTLMRLFLLVRAEIDRLVENGVRLTVIGQRERLPAAVRSAVETAEAATARGTRLHLRLALNYSARLAIMRAAARFEAGSEPTLEEFSRVLREVDHDNSASPDVDLLIRTGGEQRLSDFLLWECAYAELFFTPVMWPDFTGEDLARAVQEFQRRDRRFGGVHAVPQPLSAATV